MKWNKKKKKKALEWFLLLGNLMLLKGPELGCFWFHKGKGLTFAEGGSHTHNSYVCFTILRFHAEGRQCGTKRSGCAYR